MKMLDLCMAVLGIILILMMANPPITVDQVTVSGVETLYWFSRPWLGR
jgi:hypothetical protein